MKRKFYQAEAWDPIFRAHFHILFGSNEDFGLWNKERGLSAVDPNMDAYCGWYDKVEGHGVVRHYLIYFEEYGFTAIVHETNHLAMRILIDRGLEANNATMEAYAYYQAWLAGQCRDMLEKWTKEPVKKKKSGAPAEPWGKRSMRRNRRSR